MLFCRTLVEEASATLTDIENAATTASTATHASHYEVPKTDEQEDGKDCAKYAHQPTTFFLKGHFSFIINAFQERINLVRTRVARRKRRVLTGLVHILFKHFLNVFAKYNKTHLSIRLIHHNIIGVTLLDVGLEF